MTTNLGNIAATASLNIDPFQQSTRVLETQMRSINNALKAQETSFKNNSKSINAQKAQYTLTGKAIDNYSAQLVKQKEKYNGLKQSIGDVNNATADQKTQLLSAEATMNKTIGEIERLSGEYKTLGTQIAISESNWTKAGQVLENVGGRVSKAGDTLNSFGNKWTVGVTAPLVAGVGATVKAAMDWESAFAGVKKTNDEVVDSNGNVVYSYKDLEDGLRGLAKELPASHKEIAAVAEAAGQLGVQTENVTAFTKTMIDMGESTNLSAETAATELARFANIVGMSQDKFSNLGSAIVELGNNYATTESEISAMALRLAGAGKQIGMSEGDILGFAAALSSVGVEAEAGGSAFSKVMVQMQLATEKGVGAFDELKGHAADQGVSWERLVIAIQNGGKELTGVSKEMGFTSSELKKMYKEADKSKTSLEQFADVAGMTGDQFAKMFKEDPSTAIMKFVEGLSKAEESGTSAIKVLDDMDIKEVRLRDSLLRAANASGIFGEAIETGNSAFEENTALAEEAGKRYETVESQLGMLKNEVTDVAIEFGGPFLGALRDGVKVAKPFIKTLADMAKKFSEANPETQQAIMKYIGLAAAIGPASKVMGGFLKITGGGISTVGKLSQWLGKMSGTAKASKTALEIAGTGATTFGSAASAAAGSQGVGAMITALGSGGLAGALPLIVGAGGLLALGYGAWKTFGEEAWNSSQRVSRWGEDVGVATDKTLKTIQDKTQTANGEFGLMAQGFETNTDSMVSNFQKIGSVIENDLTSKLEAYRKAVDLLPSELQEKANEYIEQKEQEAQHALEIVEKNNEEILQIKKKYVDEEGNVTAQGAKMIQDLMRESTEEYLNIAVTDADKRKEVMNALTGDLSTATEKQAQDWLVSLAKQRQATKTKYTEDINDYRKKLEDEGQLNQEEIDTMVGFYEKARETSTDAFDAQMALIVQKYPELANKISLSNGQLIKSAGEGTEGFIEENQKILDNAENLANKLAENARKNAEQLAWTADQATLAGKTWNDLELIDKEGKVKTNAAEIVKEATKDATTWNNMRMVIHDANLDSNAKLVIGEAAIANGWWDGMAWEDKQAILEEDFQQTIFQALRANGDWDKMSFEDKKAFLYSNTPETMAETMANLGLWDKYQPEIKNLGADNTKLLEVLLVSEDRMAHWNSLPDDVKEIVADNYDLTSKIYQSERMFNAWKKMPDSEKKMLGNNEDLILKILGSEATLNAWNQLPAVEKQLLGNNQDVLAKILASEENYNRWTGLPEVEKHILGNNGDLLAKVMESEGSLAAWNSLPTDIKVMLGNNQDIMKKVADGTISIETYNKRIYPALKTLYGDNASIKSALQGATDGVNYYNRNITPNTKTMNGVDNASGPAGDAFRSVLNFKNNLPDTITKTVRANFIGPVLPGKATGDPYFQGGPVWLGDGGKREPFLTPQGDFGISPATWTPYNLPKGTKIWPSIQKMMETIPRYATGTKFDDTMLSRLTPVNTRNRNDSKLDQLISLLQRFFNGEASFAVEGDVYIDDNRTVGRVLTPYITENQERIKRLKRRGKGEF